MGGAWSRGVTEFPCGSSARDGNKCVMLNRSALEGSGSSDSSLLSEAFSSSLLCFSH